MTVFHPTGRLLRRWMADPLPGRMERHLNRCDRCSSRLSTPEHSPTLRELLAAFVAAPAGLEHDMVEQIAQREAEAKADLGLVLDLLGVWLDTGRVVFRIEGDNGVRNDG